MFFSNGWFFLDNPVYTFFWGNSLTEVAEPICGMKAPNEFGISYSKPANDSDPIKQLESVSVHISSHIL